MKIDHKDFEILKELQKDCKQSLKKLSRKLNMSITTLYDRIKKLEREGVITNYRAIVDPEKTDMSFISLIFIRMRYHYPGEKEPLSQREVAKKLSFIPGVQQVYIISGEWDILVKARGRNIKEIADIVIDQIRKIKGIDRTLTSNVWVTTKESSVIEFIKSNKKS